MLFGQKYFRISSVYVHLYIMLKNIPDLKLDNNAAVIDCWKTITNELEATIIKIDSVLTAAMNATVVNPHFKLLKLFDEAPR